MRSIDCLVVGSVNIDNIFSVNHICKSGETLLSSKYEEAPGGKGSNQAAALSKSGLSCALITCIGNDGVWIKNLLHELGVETTFFTVSPSLSTGRAIIQVSEQDGDNAIILFNGANDKVSFDHAKLDLSWKWLLLQGEINIDACNDAINHSITRIRRTEFECIICLNAAPCSKSLIEGISLSSVDILFVNETELQDLANILLPDREYNMSKGDLINSTQEFSRLIMQKLSSLKLVITTLGELGACAYLSSSIFLHGQVKRSVNVIDTVGAGDTFCGYFIESIHNSSLQFKKLISDCLLDHSIVHTALNRAVMASGLACEIKGALSSIPSKSKVDGHS